MHFKKSPISFEVAALRRIPCFVCILYLLSCAIDAWGEWSLPQNTEKTSLTATARSALEKALSAPAGTAPGLLSGDSSAAVVASLPKAFRDSCHAIVEQWPGAQGTDQWSARVLFRTRTEVGIEAVLALRCGSSLASMKDWYDERPAVVELTRESGSLRVVPVEKDCNGCERFYHVDFPKSYAAAGTRLVEVQAYYSDDNPCCDGTDHKEGNRLVVVSLPAGEQVLSLVQFSDENSVDDEAETDTEWVCEAKIDYDGNAPGNVEMIRAETHCTVDKKPEPEVKKQSFRWNPLARRFEEEKAFSR